MTQEIRKRIYDIKSGIVPEGYKQTPFGIFPCDWCNPKKFGDIAYLSNSKFNRKQTEDNPICVELDHIESKTGRRLGNSFGQEQDSVKTIFKKGDILFGKLRPYLCKYYLAKEDGVCSTEIWVIKNKNDINNLFLYQFVSSEKFAKDVGASSFGSKMPRGEWRTVENTYYVIPKNKNEQGKIAEILMKWDEAVELQEQYIEKLEIRKKAYIDKFFIDREVNCCFKELYVEAGEGGTPDTKIEEYYLHGDIPFVKIEHLSKKYIEEIDSFITKKGLNKSGAWLVPKDSLLFSNGATIGECSINRIPVTTKQGILGIVPSNKIELEYFYYLIMSDYFLNKVRKITTKGTMYTAYLKDIDKLKLFIHKKEKQTIIANFFGEADEEISLQKEKLKKIKEQRKALQQYLLTGIVRVKT